MEILAGGGRGGVLAVLLLLLLALTGGAEAFAHHVAGGFNGRGGGAGERRYRDLAAGSMQSVRSSFGAARRGLATSPANGRVFHVTDYGADPTGGTDATAAIKKAIADAFAPPIESFPVSDSRGGQR